MNHINDLTVMIVSKYLIRKSITPNPRIVDTEARGKILRYFIVSPHTSSVQKVIEKGLVDRDLPYRLCAAGFSIEDGAYLDFVEKTS